MTTTSRLELTTVRGQFCARTWGDVDGIPLLLLHGSFGSSRWWELCAAALPTEFYAVAPDLRGVGCSVRTETGYAVEEQAADVHAIVTALDWDDFHLLAHSSGGAIAMEFVLRFPHAAATLTLVDTVPAEGIFTPVDTYLLLEQMKTDRALLHNALSLLMPSFAHDESHAENARFFEQLVDDAQAQAPAAFTAVARGLGLWNRFGEVRRIAVPTLLVWGDRDTIVLRDATTRTLLAIPGANNLEVIRGAGHCPQIEAPQTLVACLVDFITQDFADFDAIRRSARDE